MKFPTLASGKTGRFTVEALQGGCNLRDGSRLAADGQLTAVKNLWWQNGALRTRPGFRANASYTRNITNRDVTWKFCSEDTNGAYAGRRFLRREYIHESDTVTMQTGILTHDGKIIFEGWITTLPADTTGMVMEYPYSLTEDVLIFLSDGRIYAQNSAQMTWRQVNNEAYVPCVLIGGEGVKQLTDPPSTAGTPYEGRNMLTDKFTAKYTTTGTGIVFHFPYTDLDENQPVTISISYLNGGVVDYVIPARATECGYGSNGLKPHVDRKKGIFYFLAEEGGLTPPLPGFANNMTVSASKAWTATEKSRIASMSFAAWLGGSQAGCDSRQFISGSPEHPNRIYWSGQGQPLYFPETNYVAVGDINQAITAFGKQDGMLVIFKEREIYSLSRPEGTVSAEKVDGQLVQAVTATSDYFPLTQLHGQVGCTAPHSVVLCGNRLCWADGKGSVYTLIGDSVGYTVRELSTLIAPALREHSKAAWAEATAVVFRGYYLLCVDHTIYALRVDEKAFKQYAGVYNDSKAQQNLAWYVWELPQGYIIQFLVTNGYALSASARYETGAGQFELPLYAEDGGDSKLIDGSWVTVPLASSISTKEYDFGNPVGRKRVLRVHLGLENAQDAAMQFAYIRNGERITEAKQLKGMVSGDIVLTPNLARTLRFGFAVQATGTVAVDTLTFTYR